MLNNEQISTLWPQIKLGLMNVWGKLSEEELERTHGNFSAIAGLIEEKYLEEKGAIKEKFENLLSSFDNDTDKGMDPDKSSYHREPYGKDLNPRHSL